mmetsp:Transcript_6163/g.15131  ORF Transcript_6163/g.15131 Transcript_6163/m.15131 type:complete len:100 (-) Transcript_6163:45-344(-)
MRGSVVRWPRLLFRCGSGAPSSVRPVGPRCALRVLGAAAASRLPVEYTHWHCTLLVDGGWTKQLLVLVLPGGAVPVLAPPTGGAQLVINPPRVVVITTI